MPKLTTAFLNGRLLRTFILFAFLCGLNLTSYSQLTSLTNQTQVAEYLGDDRFNELLSSNPSYLTFLDTRCSYGYQVMDMPAEKTIGMTVLNNVTYTEWDILTKSEETILKSMEHIISAADFVQKTGEIDFNFLLYQLPFNRGESTFYVLGNTGKVIVIYSTEFINKKISSTN